MRDVGQLRAAAFNAGDDEGVLLVVQVVTAALAVDDKVIVSQLVAVEALAVTYWGVGKWQGRGEEGV